MKPFIVSPQAKELARFAMKHRHRPDMQVSDLEVELVHDLASENLRLKEELRDARWACWLLGAALMLLLGAFMFLPGSCS